MLAIRLHKTKNSRLGRGAYLIPIVEWKTARSYVNRWVNVLNWHNTRRSNNKVRYITLVRIPDSHRISLHSDWICSAMGLFDFKQLVDIPADAKKRLGSWIDDVPEPMNITAGDPRGIPAWVMPELVLGEALARKSVIWTKDIRLLYQIKRGRSTRARR